MNAFDLTMGDQAEPEPSPLHIQFVDGLPTGEMLYIFHWIVLLAFAICFAKV